MSGVVRKQNNVKENSMTKAQRKLMNLIEDADNVLETKTNRAAAESKLRELGATDSDGQFIRPNQNPGFDEVFDLFM